ncbi:alpha/beta hydrolase [Spirillospora albida]|uniref:alpha/beta hydrolase n=1 Tax=Spirillospora albida TaxID=58123 RepID=UPI0004BEFAEF|nr:alpha/beta hydrolase [Spirillospora albida]
MRAKLIGAAVTALALTACNSEPPRPPAPAGLSSFYGQKPSWKDCDGGFECATIDVPLDYAAPAAGTIELAVIRLPADGDRIGSLLTNPGGPGGSGVAFVRQAVGAFSTDLRKRFDIVGFDPRGVATSAPIRCNTTQDLDAFFAADASPDDEREKQTYASASRAFAQNCATKEARDLPHVGTLNAARDMDILRSSLGDPKLTYFGASYGTYLGATYAELFPRNVRALVLDGAVDPTTTSTGLLAEQAKGFETALRAFAEDCVQKNCPLGTTPAAVLSTVDELQAKTDRTPLTSSRDQRKVTESLVTMGIARALYAKEYWPVLRQALTAAVQRSDGTMLLSLADEMVERKDGSYSNQMDANMAVNCVDKPNPPDLKTYAKAADQATRESPRFGPFVVWSGLPCVYWKPRTDRRPTALTAKGAAPILVIGTTRDPATPYKWAENLATQLSSGVLLTLDGDGHTAYLQGDPCITRATDRYLISATPPRPRTTCR